MTKRSILSLVVFILIILISGWYLLLKDSSLESDQNQLSHPLLKAVEWISYSAEYEALCHQTFQLAEQRLLQALASKENSLPAAVVLDVDETLLNNVGYEWFLIHNNRTYESTTWKQWSDSAKATAIPGAIDFLNAVYQQKVAIVLISNRKVEEIESTAKNLNNLGFPPIPLKNFHFKEETSGKQFRRNSVLNNYDVLLYLGDNLDDFDAVFEDRLVSHGKAEVEKHRQSFGDRYFILPNPMYGSWEKSTN